MKWKKVEGIHEWDRERDSLQKWQDSFFCRRVEKFCLFWIWNKHKLVHQLKQNYKGMQSMNGERAKEDVCLIKKALYPN